MIYLDNGKKTTVLYTPTKQGINKMQNITDFKNMHEQNELLFLPNAWDIISAKILEQSGFKAIGTTSWGLANAMGYKDGERIPFKDFIYQVKNIIDAVKIPVTVDIESGYSDDISTVVNNVLEVAELGAVGINIEDSFKNKTGLINVEKQCLLISSIRSSLNEKGYVDFFINARTDTYIQLENPLDETITRAKKYELSGASGIFVPCISEALDIKALINEISLPLNVMSLPNLNSIHELNDLGIKRFSIGNALSDASIAFIEKQVKDMIELQSSANLYSKSTIRTEFK